MGQLLGELTVTFQDRSREQEKHWPGIQVKGQLHTHPSCLRSSSGQLMGDERPPITILVDLPCRWPNCFVLVHAPHLQRCPSQYAWTLAVSSFSKNGWCCFSSNRLVVFLPSLSHSVLLDLGHLNLGPLDGVCAASPKYKKLTEWRSFCPGL